MTMVFVVQHIEVPSGGEVVGVFSSLALALASQGLTEEDMERYTPTRWYATSGDLFAHHDVAVEAFTVDPT